MFALTSFVSRLGAKTGFALALLTTGAYADPFNANADYVVSLGGINIASVSVAFKDDGKRYDVDIDAAVSGVGSLVASGSASADSHGRSSAKGLNSAGFTIETKSRAEHFNVAVQFASGDATGFQVEPPIVNNVDRIALERKHLRGVSDPVGSFILKGNALDANLCNRRLKVFTGIERYDIAMSFAEMTTATSNRTGYQGPVVLCQLRYVPVSGHYTNSEMTAYLASSKRILIWYAPLGDTGFFIPYRIIIGTSAGDLSVVLTKLG